MRSFTDDFPNNSGRSAAAPSFPDYVENVRLPADTLVRVAVPSLTRFAIFSFDGDVRVRIGTAATALAADTATSDGSGSELNPAARRIPRFLSDGTTVPTHICLRAAASASSGSISFYA